MFPFYKFPYDFFRDYRKETFTWNALNDSLYSTVRKAHEMRNF